MSRARTWKHWMGALVLALLAVAGTLWAGVLGYTLVSVTQTAQTTTLPANTSSVTIYNAGANEAFVQIYRYHRLTGAETVVAATTNSPMIRPGFSVSATWGDSAFEQEGGYYSAVSSIASTGETTTLDVISK
jgi:hypothetical protein